MVCPSLSLASSSNIEYEDYLVPSITLSTCQLLMLKGQSCLGGYVNPTPKIQNKLTTVVLRLENRHKTVHRDLGANKQ